MADTVINGTAGNDTIQANAAGSSNGSLVLTIAGTIAEGILPQFDVLINGVVVRASVIDEANDFNGVTQQVYVALPAGAINSVTIDYTNDPQQDYSTQDRNVVLKSVVLNGTTLPFASATYTRDGFTGPDGNIDTGHVITGQGYMSWGGELTWSGSLVSGATAGAGGNVLIDGGAGIDTVNFANAFSTYTVSHAASGFSIGNTSFGSVERLSFADGTHLAIDTDGHAGMAAEMINAVFGGAFLSSKSIVGQALMYLDQGMAPETLLGIAVELNDFKALAGGSSNTDFVNYVYHNVVGVNPSAADLNFYVSLLDNHTFTKGQLALLATNLDLNEQHVALTGVFDHGIQYS